MNAIGVLGGTFDPIHYGHLRLAQEVAEALGLSQVRFIPSALPPHRQQPSPSASQRAEMVSLAIAGNPLFSLDGRELDRGGPSYTIDTLLSLRQELGDDTALCLCLGSDAFQHFDTWHRWQEILDHCHLVLVERPASTQTLPAPLRALLDKQQTDDAGRLLASKAGFIWRQRITALDISATAIRTAFQQNRSPRYLLPEAVTAYIEAHGLYR